MFKKIFLLCICIQTVLLQTIKNDPIAFDVSVLQPAAIPTNLTLEIQDALMFSQVTISIINEYIRDKLPPSMLPQAELILTETKESLTQCESSLKRNEDIWQYKTCSSAQLRYAMVSLTSLTANYYGNSAAATHFGGVFCIFSLFSLYLMK